MKTLRIALILLAAAAALNQFSACSATNSVELFRVTENGEVVNIGRGADQGHVIYGHFRSTTQFDRAAAVVMTPVADSSDICFINVNDGQVNDGSGNGIRLDPCSDIQILNEGPITGSLDNIGLFFHPGDSGRGLYMLYDFNGSDFVPVLSRLVTDELWNSGKDILTRSDDGTLHLVFSRQNSDGSIADETQVFSSDELKTGNLIDPPKATVTHPVPESAEAPETPAADEAPASERPAPDEAQIAPPAAELPSAE